MSGHTNGPWHFVEHSWSDTGIYSLDGEPIALISISAYATEDNQDAYEKTAKANARLIAASPELLDALVHLHINFKLMLSKKPVRDVEETLAEVEKAIAKATGQQS